VARDRKKWRRIMLEAQVHNRMHVVHEKKKKKLHFSYNSCSHKKCHVKISTIFCSSLIPYIRRRCGRQRESGVDVIGLSRCLLLCFPQGRVRPLSLSVGHCTVHLAAIKQAIPFFFFLFFLLMSIFSFLHFVHPTRTLFLSSDLPFMIFYFLPRKSFDSLFS